MRKLIALLLISTQAFAGLPPTTTKGQSDSSAKVKFQFQAPHNQFTNLGGVKTLIETGNNNILPDPGFESSVSGWTASGGATATSNSTAKGTGALGYDWDSNSASQTLQSSSVTIPAGLQGKNGIASCQIKTVSGTATHTFTVNDGTNDIVTPITIQTSTTSFAGQNEGNKINFVFPTSGTIRIKLASVNANEPEIYLDDCSIKLADNVYDAPLVTAWTAYTPTITNAGTTTSVSFFYARQGNDLLIKGNFTTGTVPASLVKISLPSGLSIDTAKIATNNTTGAAGPVSGKWTGNTNANHFGPIVTATATDASAIYFGSGVNSSALFQFNAVSIFSNTEIVSLEASVPILGWSSVSAVSADQTDYDWTSYTPTFTGFGTPSSIECQHSRVSANLLLKCKFLSGTPTGVEARISLPNSLTSADTTKIPSIYNCGKNVYSQTAATDGTILCEPSVQYITFGQQSGSFGGLTKLTGTNAIGGTNTMSLTASIPIQGWSSNQRAPTLVGSVTSDSASAMKLTNINTTTACSTGTCATANNDGFSSCTFVSTGIYDCSFSSSYGSIPFCQSGGTDTWGGNAPVCGVDIASTLVSKARVICRTSGANTVQNAAFTLFCKGPR